jgi:hypothetical protein
MYLPGKEVESVTKRKAGLFSPPENAMFLAKCTTSIPHNTICVLWEVWTNSGQHLPLESLKCCEE